MTWCALIHDGYCGQQCVNVYTNLHVCTSSYRQIIKNALHCDSDKDVLIFTGSGCTGAVHKLVSCLCLDKLPQPAVVFVSIFEHHSNLLPWRELGAEVVCIGEDASGGTNIAELEEKLKVGR